LERSLKGSNEPIGHAKPSPGPAPPSRLAESAEVYERGGVDVAINPRHLTAEEMLRFAHDPRIHQIAMLEGDRFEILDIRVRPDSQLVDRPLDRQAARRLAGDQLASGRRDP
jgi:Trk K+ transport system NAD-binding subunit